MHKEIESSDVVSSATGCRWTIGIILDFEFAYRIQRYRSSVLNSFFFFGNTDDTFSNQLPSGEKSAFFSVHRNDICVFFFPWRNNTHVLEKRTMCVSLMRSEFEKNVTFRYF